MGIVYFPKIEFSKIIKVYAKYHNQKNALNFIFK